jgi:hypothetical protein
MNDTKNDSTTAWKYYELGREYNNRLVPNQYRTVDTNWEFFSGNQWLHIPETPAMSRLSRPVFNIIKRIASLFVASINSTATTVSFEPLNYYDGDHLDDPDSNAAVYATEEVRNLYEKFKMEYRTREALFDGAVTGDYCAHFYWNPDAMPYGGAYGNARGEIEMELVDGINVMFGNPNVSDVESQPYILVIGRDTVENLKWEADRYRKNKKAMGKGGTASSKNEVDSIDADSEWQWQTGIGGETELPPDDDKTGKALYVYLYTKVSKEVDCVDENGLPVMEDVLDEDGNPVPETDKKGKAILDMNGQPVYKKKNLKKIVTSVHVTKATRTVNIFEDVDTGLTHYPIAWGNWEKQKNQYHGRALVTGIVPNQIFINSMFAMIFRHLQLQSFPKTIYNADLVSQWNNEIGVALGVRGLQPGQDLRTVATVLQPSDMSNQIVMCIDKCMMYTKECLGATDAQMGNLALENTSALMVLQSSSEAPLENPRQGMLEWNEDIARILLDMMGTYYGQRPIVRQREFREPILGPDGAPQIDPMTGQMQEKTIIHRVIEDYDFSQFKNLWFNIKVNAGATTQYSEIAMVQTLDNLRREGVLEIVDYLERIPDKLIPRKQELIDSIKQKTGQMGSEAVQQEMNQAMGTQASKDPSQPTKGGEGLMAMGGPLDSAKRISQMPSTIQNKFQDLPGKAQKALLRQVQTK